MDISIEDFQEEMAERLSEWELCTLDFEKDPSNQVLTNNLFRVVHTVKGTAGVCGYEPIVRISHELESYLDDVRRHRASANRDIIDLLLRACDIIRRITYDAPGSQQYEQQVKEIKEAAEAVRLQKTARSESPAQAKLTQLTVQTIGSIRTDALDSLNLQKGYDLDLSSVQECDVEGIHFICSLVPVFVRSGKPLQLAGISDFVVNKAFTLGIDIRNVLKRASFGSSKSAQAPVSRFTITLHPAVGAEITDELQDAVKNLRELILRDGTVTESCSTQGSGAKSCTLLAASPMTRSELEKELEKLPDQILWTISLTPDQIQKTDALRQIGKSEPQSDAVMLVREFAENLSHLQRAVLASGNPELQHLAGKVAECQQQIRSASTSIDSLPLGVFTASLKAVRGD